MPLGITEQSQNATVADIFQQKATCLEDTGEGIGPDSNYWNITGIISGRPYTIVQTDAEGVPNPEGGFYLVKSGSIATAFLTAQQITDVYDVVFNPPVPPVQVSQGGLSDQLDDSSQITISHPVTGNYFVHTLEDLGDGSYGHIIREITHDSEIIAEYRIPGNDQLYFTPIQNGGIAVAGTIGSRGFVQFFNNGTELTERLPVTESGTALLSSFGITSFSGSDRVMVTFGELSDSGETTSGYGRIFGEDESGSITALTDEFRVNAEGELAGRQVSAVSSADGERMSVSFNQRAGAGASRVIMSVSQNGTLTPEQIISSGSILPASSSPIFELEDGTRITAYSTQTRSYARAITPEGELNPEFEVPLTVANRVIGFAMGMLPDGSLVAARQAMPTAQDSRVRVEALRYNITTGTQIGQPLMVSMNQDLDGENLRNAFLSGLEVMSDGRILIHYNDENFASFFGNWERGRFIAANWTLSPEFQIAQIDYSVLGAHVAALPKGEFAAAYSFKDSATPRKIMAEVLDGEGQQISICEQINGTGDLWCDPVEFGEIPEQEIEAGGLPRLINMEDFISGIYNISTLRLAIQSIVGGPGQLRIAQALDSLGLNISAAEPGKWNISMAAESACTYVTKEVMMAVEASGDITPDHPTKPKPPFDITPHLPWIIPLAIAVGLGTGYAIYRKCCRKGPAVRAEGEPEIKSGKDEEHKDPYDTLTSDLESPSAVQSPTYMGDDTIETEGVELTARSASKAHADLKSQDFARDFSPGDEGEQPGLGEAHFHLSSNLGSDPRGSVSLQGEQDLLSESATRPRSPSSEAREASARSVVALSELSSSGKPAASGPKDRTQ